INAGEVEPFVKRAVVHRAVAEKRDGNAAVLEQLEAVARPRRLENARPDDAAGAHQADFWGKQVHAAAAAVRAARLAAVEFRDQVAGVQPLGERVAVAAVGAENGVLMPQVSANADSNRLLADVGVASPVNKAALVRPGQLLLAPADEEHPAI